MFEIPNAKRVRRRDLYSTSPSPTPSTPDPAVRVRLRQEYEAACTLPALLEEVSSPAVLSISPTPAKGDLGAPDNDEAFEFRLFSKPVPKPLSSEQAPEKFPRILIRSPSPVSGESGFVQPRRPDKFYFATPPNVEQRCRLEATAISGDAIVAEQAHKWPGCALPWKVLTITVPAALHSRATAAIPSRSSTNRKRVGKKRRIIVRKRLASIRAEEAVSNMTAAEKEAAEREKRTRRNREKKVKKKCRDKLKRVVKLSPS